MGWSDIFKILMALDLAYPFHYPLVGQIAIGPVRVGILTLVLLSVLYRVMTYILQADGLLMLSDMFTLFVPLVVFSSGAVNNYTLTHSSTEANYLTFWANIIRHGDSVTLYSGFNERRNKHFGNFIRS